MTLLRARAIENQAYCVGVNRVGLEGKMEYSGNSIGLANALWTGFELLDSKQEGEFTKARIKLLNGHSTNELLTVLLPHVSIHSLHEVIPGMNEIFISKINEETKADR